MRHAGPWQPWLADLPVGRSGRWGQLRGLGGGGAEKEAQNAEAAVTSVGGTGIGTPRPWPSTDPWRPVSAARCVTARDRCPQPRLLRVCPLSLHWTSRGGALSGFLLVGWLVGFFATERAFSKPFSVKETWAQKISEGEGVVLGEGPQKTSPATPAPPPHRTQGPRC